MEITVKGKTALVIGGSKGLGYGMAEGLASTGANVVIVSRRKEQLDEAAAKMRASTGNENIIGIPADIRSLEAINGLVEAVVEKFGQIDILINSAGVNRRTDAIDFTEEEWDLVMDTQLKYVFFMGQAVARQMRDKGIKGSIINIGSLTCVLGLRNMIAYCAAKGGIAQLSKAMANEFAPYGIRVNAIGPGYFETEMTGPIFNNPKRKAELFARIPQERFGLPSDLAGMAVYLGSDASEYVTGQVLYVDGGYLTT